jgi:hypothetical protein
MRLLRTAVGLSGLALAGSLLTGCGGDAEESYCASVAEQAPALAKTLDVGGAKKGLLDAVPVLEDLAAAAPGDVASDWKTLLDALTGLQDALDRAGLKPGDVDGTLPADLPAADRKALEAASIRLASPATVKAANAVDQHARDVCHVPLF